MADLERCSGEELIGEFMVLPFLSMCSGCGEREFVVKSEKDEGGKVNEYVVCRHGDRCRAVAMYNLGEGGVK